MFLRSESATVMQIVDCLKEISRTQLKRYRTILSTNVKPITDLGTRTSIFLNIIKTPFTLLNLLPEGYLLNYNTILVEFCLRNP